MRPRLGRLFVIVAPLAALGLFVAVRPLASYVAHILRGPYVHADVPLGADEIALSPHEEDAVRAGLEESFAVSHFGPMSPAGEIVVPRSIKALHLANRLGLLRALRRAVTTGSPDLAMKAVAFAQGLEESTTMGACYAYGSRDDLDKPQPLLDYATRRDGLIEQMDALIARRRTP